MLSLFRIEFISQANPKALEVLRDSERILKDCFDRHQSKYFLRLEI